jgi:hypothetical protein
VGAGTEASERLFGFVGDERLRLLAGHWMECRDRRRAPERRDIDPAAIRRVLPFVWLCEREGRRRYRFRLAGEEVNRLYRRSLRGRFAEEVFAARHCELEIDMLEVVLGTPAIWHCRGDLYRSDTSSVPGERLLLPLYQADELRLVLGATIYAWRGAAAPMSEMNAIEHQPTIVPLDELP